MRLIFAGTPEFARVALTRLVDAGHEIVLVLTQPDRPAGRGMKLQASAVKQASMALHLPVLQARSLRLDGKFPDDAVQARLAIEQARAQAMVVAAYGLILPQWVLDEMGSTGRLGCLNIHASLLPRWRGAAPIHRAIEAGDAQTGVTIMQMDAGLDTGDMLLWQSTPIAPTDTTALLHDRLAGLGGALIVQALDLAARGELKQTAQPRQGVTYAAKLDKDEAWIDWTQAADLIVRRVHAFNPFPVAVTRFQGASLKVWDARVAQGVVAANAPPGSILAVNGEGVAVAASNSVVLLTELQRSGARRLPVAECLRGMDIQPGMQLGGADHPDQPALS
ncbi:methionyl-tRNA formyltransferase [Rhodoferax sp.]|uniref:methionyl-tRNA formyltransferase n=1 Tax=Rhodoferax sp. TaxID=50421 RepID=UPI002752B52B|nr:methionyl-tRNA formyltransferase [Rhodoferax sp.]